MWNNNDNGIGTSSPWVVNRFRLQELISDNLAALTLDNHNIRQISILVGSAVELREKCTAGSTLSVSGWCDQYTLKLEVDESRTAVGRVNETRIWASKALCSLHRERFAFIYPLLNDTACPAAFCRVTTRSFWKTSTRSKSASYKRRTSSNAIFSRILGLIWWSAPL